MEDEASSDSGEGPEMSLGLSLMATGAAVIALGTLAVEIWTGQFPIRALGFRSGFVSLPVGAVASAFAAWTASHSVRRALSPLALACVYWIGAVVYW